MASDDGDNSPPPICRAIVNSRGEAVFESTKTKSLSLSQIIENDKKYGTFQPANGKYYTYKILSEGEEFKHKQIERAYGYAHLKWRIYANLPKLKQWRQERDHDYPPDFRLDFRTVDTGDRLTKNTIMYHFYPIQVIHSPYRGLCVVNKDMFFTSHGNSVKGSVFLKHGIQANPESNYKTYDFDGVLCHELGHGKGLGHDTESNSIMSTPYSDFAENEMPSMRDQSRIKAKYGHRNISSWWLRRWIKILKVISDR